KFAVEPSATEPLVTPEPCSGTVIVRAPVRSPQPIVTDTAADPGDEHVASDSRYTLIAYSPTVTPVSRFVVEIAAVCVVTFTGPPDVLAAFCNSNAGVYSAVPKYPVAGRKLVVPTEY